MGNTSLNRQARQIFPTAWTYIDAGEQNLYTPGYNLIQALAYYREACNHLASPDQDLLTIRAAAYTQGYIESKLQGYRQNQ